jgi:hypothetical protein
MARGRARIITLTGLAGVIVGIVLTLGLQGRQPVLQSADGRRVIRAGPS